MNATSPNPIIVNVSKVTKNSAFIFDAIVIPNNKVTKLANSFCAVCDSLSKTPHSLIKFPNIKNPTRDTAVGAINPAIIVTTIGKSILVVFDTDAGLYFILICLSFFVVTSLIAIGCMIGTKDIYV
ncbi:hypothetical protein SDC9_79887 [bioreactor metagenome]|uniref:Uncharacterized protein n=1 Tax=bioreactor metagenome TaxID=1076179 RepID=A0A644Z5D1_9ZZZZ